MNLMNRRAIVKYTDGKFISKMDDVAVEYPITVLLNGKEFITIVCTPQYIEDMVIGFLASEKIVADVRHLTDIRWEESTGIVHVTTDQVFPFYEKLQNKRYITSCCGMSRQGFVFANDALAAKQLNTRNVHLSSAECFRLMAQMDAHADLFHQTGGVHIASLCNPHETIVRRMDIGRHNALDKIYGYCLRENIPIEDKVVVFSGRISSEILLKVSKIGCEVVLSKSAPTDLAIDLADELGITAVGFIRQNTFNVYSHPERITDG
ncbi:FdhD protein [Sporosarcina luteola]|nr:FdhD protein [Sporosarcina luteola]